MCSKSRPYRRRQRIEEKKTCVGLHSHLLRPITTHNTQTHWHWDVGVWVCVSSVSMVLGLYERNARTHASSKCVRTSIYMCAVRQRTHKKAHRFARAAATNTQFPNKTTVTVLRVNRGGDVWTRCVCNFLELKTAHADARFIISFAVREWVCSNGRNDDAVGKATWPTRIIMWPSRQQQQLHEMRGMNQFGGLQPSNLCVVCTRQSETICQAYRQETRSRNFTVRQCTGQIYTNQIQ